MLAEIEAKLKEALGGAGAPQTLDEIETMALQIGQAVKAQMMQELVAAAPQQAALEACEGCGGKLKRKRKKWVVTRAGEVQVERDYYYCEGCQPGFPPG